MSARERYVTGLPIVSASPQSTLRDHGGGVDLDTNRPDCREDMAHLRARNTETGETAQWRCDQWHCACCGYRMKMNLLEGIDQLVERRPAMSRFLTLTTDPSRFYNRKQAHRKIGEGWNRLRNYIRSSYGDFSFVWVREETKEGWPHLHIIVSRFLPQGEISAAWDRAGMGSVVDIRKVEARKAGHYMAKYLAKDAMANLPSGVHRFGSSSDIELAVRGDTSNDEDTPWVIEAKDRITGVYTEALPADFVRRKPPPAG